MDTELFDKVYESIVNRQPTYDGIYYTGVKTTKIVCRPSCRARTPKRENITLYPNLKSAIRDGFRPCKRCKPETPGTLNPDAMLAAQVDAIISANYTSALTLSSLADQLAISPYHLQRTYKRVTDRTPIERLHQVRLKEAKFLLADRKLTISGIALSVGYKHASHFAVWFREQTGLSPTAYRAAIQSNAESRTD
ncbi:bifunctional transcriptional activator/DNA repair enzyme AdaA [Paenibacillus radicis (ex Gao et al. 2016)]|uniref:Bifunctional transcriptional activator/DNA repair enzyme AdaA n=1 Tax=Paenibacillus radicis (ex Gao et al. 2016) TaxID=1737354 RepID=A0A917H4A4_9BACL|nr:Ada metal-binding domain-containing protein [Paenibacillus radicis (ex Gao et al. 2016)]GGG67502.1 bifunctional transcriptional activator/DNA repair enzyme AdaA [Paenibacillus radicis (ex Gao et al. 2016)]